MAGRDKGYGNSVKDVICKEYPFARAVGKESVMKVFVATGDWGGARILDIRAVAKDVVNQLCKYFPDLRYLGSDLIVIQKSQDGCPRAIYREDMKDPFFISLNTMGNKWAQVAYQFAHELCHVVSNHDRLRKKENQWFHESLCELASIFCVLQMAESWKTNPPYANWKDYAPHLATYALEFLGRPQHKLPEKMTFANWFKDQVASMRADSCNREKNAIVAIKLLPLFEEEPKRWESIAYIPNSDGTFEKFLREWKTATPEYLRGYIDQIAAIFEIDFNVKQELLKPESRTGTPRE